MLFTRKHAVLFLAIAAWNVVSYAQFTRALATTEEDRAVGYYVAHTVLIVVNLVIAAVLGRLGWRAWRATAIPAPDATKGATEQDR